MTVATGKRRVVEERYRSAVASETFRLSVETLRLLFLTRERLDDAESGQSVGERGVQRARASVRPRVQRVHTPEQSPDREREERYHDERAERERHVHYEHDDESGDDLHHVFDKVRRAVHEEPVYLVAVVVYLIHQPARLARGEERHRKPLDRGEDRLFQLIGDLRRHACGDHA